MLIKSKILNCRKKLYSGKVYNLHLKSEIEIQNIDDLFWIDGNTGLVTHNCFPKDVNALLHLMKENNVDSTLLSAQWQKNLLLRPDRDWEQLKGRAVTETSDVGSEGR